MHTLNCNNGTTFHYNSDLSGEVIITRKKNCSNSTAIKMLREITFDDDISISGDDILEFVASYIQLQRISVLEKMTPAQILGTERPAKGGQK